MLSHGLGEARTKEESVCRTHCGRIVNDRNQYTRRTLQRLFERYVGVGPKWVIRRYRLHEVAERLSEGKAVNLAELALDLGYFEQAHFIKDFRALVGVTPAGYARG